MLTFTWKFNLDLIDMERTIGLHQKKQLTLTYLIFPVFEEKQTGIYLINEFIIR